MRIWHLTYSFIAQVLSSSSLKMTMYMYTTFQVMGFIRGSKVGSDPNVTAPRINPWLYPENFVVLELADIPSKVRKMEKQILLLVALTFDWNFIFYFCLDFLKVNWKFFNITSGCFISQNIRYVIFRRITTLLLFVSIFAHYK